MKLSIAKPTIMLFFLVFSMTCSLADAGNETYSTIVHKAKQLLGRHEVIKAANLYEKAFSIKTGNNWDYYNAACAWALSGDKKRAFINLNLAIDKGWQHHSHTLKDTDLASLRHDKEWQTSIDKLMRNIAEYESRFDATLMRELHDIAEKDQRYRIQMIKKQDRQANTLTELWKKQTELDLQNIRKISSIIAQHGYPGKSLVGNQWEVAFLVIQHSDIETQEKYLPLLKDAVKEGELNAASLAMLIDRINVSHDKEQIYGTQLLPTKDGKLELFPIQDAGNVNKRRAEVGLPPIEAYLEFVKSQVGQ